MVTESSNTGHYILYIKYIHKMLTILVIEVEILLHIYHHIPQNSIQYLLLYRPIYKTKVLNTRQY